MIGRSELIWLLVTAAAPADYISAVGDAYVSWTLIIPPLARVDFGYSNDSLHL
jgi:hypothetical protein